MISYKCQVIPVTIVLYFSKTSLENFEPIMTDNSSIIHFFKLLLVINHNKMIVQVTDTRSTIPNNTKFIPYRRPNYNKYFTLHSEIDSYLNIMVTHS